MSESWKEFQQFLPIYTMKAYEAEMMGVLCILYDVLGVQLPEDVKLLAGHPEAQQYFLFSFLLDMEDCMQDLMVTQTS